MENFDERISELEGVLKDFDDDTAAGDSPHWAPITRIFRLRREFLIAAVLESDDDAAKQNRLKGRAQENDYYLGFIERIQVGKLDIEVEIRTLKEYLLREQAADLAAGQGDY
jgi:hypothetical protein